MMPSRGVQRARRDAPRLFQLQCRNLSSASRRIPQTSSHLRKGLSSNPRLKEWQAPIASIYAVRHASSWWPFRGLKNEPPAPPIESTPPAANTSQPPLVEASTSATTTPLNPPQTIDTVIDDTASLDTITIDPPTVLPDTLGYLHSLGLDFGWGPTSTLQWLIEHFHVWGGLPWWGSIAAASILLRLTLMPFYLKSSDISAKQMALSPVLKPIQDKISAARAAGDNQATQAAVQEMMAVRKKAGLSFPAQFAPMILQGVFGYGGFRILNHAAKLPVPEFKTGGFLWLSDLTVPDPYLILPIAMAGVTHYLVRIGGEGGAAQMDAMGQQMRKFMLWGMPGILVLIIGWQPAAVAVWFAAGGILGIGQSLLLRNPAVRDRLGLTQLYQPKPGQGNAANPLSNYIDSMMKRRKNQKEALNVAARRKEERAGGVGAAGRGMGKNEAYMRPTYQQPNLRYTSRAQSSSAQSDVSTAESMASPTPPAQSTTQTSVPPPTEAGSESSATPPGGQGGVLDRATDAWKQQREKGEQKVKDWIDSRDAETGDVDAKMQARESEVMEKRKESYDKRKKEKASKPEGKGKGGKRGR